MRLNNKLYTVTDVRHEGETTRFTLLLDPSHVIYRVHFPGEPVTPGVCLVQMAGELQEERLGRKLQLQKAVNVKFLSPVSPLSTPRITVSVSNAPADAQGAVRSSVRVEHEGRIMARMSLIHIPAATA